MKGAITIEFNIAKFKRMIKHNGYKLARQRALEFMDYSITGMEEKINKYNYTKQKVIKINDEVMIL